MERTELIEKVKSAIEDAWQVRTMQPVDERAGLAETAARAALAVFEEQQKPIEGEPVAHAIYGRVTGNLKYVQVMDEDEVKEQSEFYDVVPLFRRPVSPAPFEKTGWNEGYEAGYAEGSHHGRSTPAEPQGEPSDAQVDAAGEVLYAHWESMDFDDPTDDWAQGTRDLVRAALRAAFAVTEQGENHHVD